MIILIKRIEVQYFILEVTKFDSYNYDNEGSIALRVPWICTDHHAALFTTKGPGLTCKLDLLIKNISKTSKMVTSLTFLEKT